MEVHPGSLKSLHAVVPQTETDINKSQLQVPTAESRGSLGHAERDKHCKLVDVGAQKRQVLDEV